MVAAEQRGGALVPCIGKGWVVQFSATHRGGSCYFTIGTHLTKMAMVLTPSSSKLRTITFQAVVEKVHLAGVK